MQREEELKPTFLAISDRNRATMESHGVANNAQAQTGASIGARASPVHTIEPLEKSRKVRLLNTAACVVETEIGKFRSDTVADHMNFHAVTGIADCVFKKISEDGVDKRVVSTNRQLGQFTAKADAGFFQRI